MSEKWCTALLSNIVLIDRSMLLFAALMVLLAVTVISIIAFTYIKKANKFREIAMVIGAKLSGNKFTGVVNGIPFECRYSTGFREHSIFEVELFVSFPSPLLIYKKSRGSRMATSMGLNKEILTNDYHFDSKYYIECEDSDFAISFLDKAEVREIINATMNVHCVRYISFGMDSLAVELFNFDPSSNLITGATIKTLIHNMKRLGDLTSPVSSSIAPGSKQPSMRRMALFGLDSFDMFVIVAWFAFWTCVEIAGSRFNGNMFQNIYLQTILFSLPILAFTAIVALRINPALKGKSFSGRLFAEFITAASVFVIFAVYWALLFFSEHFHNQ